MSATVQVTEAIISLIKKNMIAKTPATVDVNVGDRMIRVQNSFHFNDFDEIILIDDGYNVEGDIHYQVFEYAQIKKVIDTRTILLMKPVVGAWMLSRNSSVQKTIGYSPLYEDQVYYGDREVIATDLMAVCVEPTNVDNEWIYIQGGLSEEYKFKLIIYGKDIKTEDGRKILDKYADVLYKLLNKNLHIGVGIYSSPLLSDAINGTADIIVEDNANNRENFVLSSTLKDPLAYVVQDNLGRTGNFYAIVAISIGGGMMRITLDRPIPANFILSEYGILIRYGVYFYDSRVTGISYGVVSKGSAILRSAELSWFGKSVDDYNFPQTFKNVEYFDEILPNTSSSSSSSSSEIINSTSSSEVVNSTNLGQSAMTL